MILAHVTNIQSMSRTSVSIPWYTDSLLFQDLQYQAQHYALCSQIFVFLPKKSGWNMLECWNQVMNDFSDMGSDLKMLA